MSRDRDAGQEGEPAFKVIDRRRFSSDGSERTEEEESRAEVPDSGLAEAAAETPVDRASQEAGEPAPVSAAPAQGEEAEPAPGQSFGEPRGEPYDPDAESLAKPSFATLVLSLSTQALLCLGEIPPQEGGQSQRDLPAARNIIDLLAVLDEKTRGNLDDKEHELLEGILYDLRMRFVQISGSEGG